MYERSVSNTSFICCLLPRQHSSVREATELAEKEKAAHERENVEYEAKISEGKVTEDGRSTK